MSWVYFHGNLLVIVYNRGSSQWDQLIFFLKSLFVENEGKIFIILGVNVRKTDYADTKICFFCEAKIILSTLIEH